VVIAAHKQSSRVYCSAKCAISELICPPGKWLRYYAPAEFDLVAGRDGQLHPNYQILQGKVAAGTRNDKRRRGPQPRLWEVAGAKGFAASAVSNGLRVPRRDARGFTPSQSSNNPVSESAANSPALPAESTIRVVNALQARTYCWLVAADIKSSNSDRDWDNASRCGQIVPPCPPANGRTALSPSGARG
jgi:hypothetical protein